MSEQLENPKEAAQKDPQESSPLPGSSVAGRSGGVAQAPRPKSRGHSRTPIRIQDDEDDEEPGFFQRHRIVLIIAGVIVLGGGFMFLSKPSGKSEPPRKAPEPPMIRIQLPPPPPPPPPKIQPPPPQKEQKQNPEQAPMAKPEQKEPAKPKPVDKPPEGLGTNIKGPGAGMAGLGGSGNGMIGGTGTGPGGGGSMGAWYAGQVKSKIVEALGNNRKTHSASISNLKFSVTVDGSGKITSAKLLTSTGDSALDEVIKNEVLIGLRLSEPPPGGKPMTVTMALSARRPK